MADPDPFRCPGAHPDLPGPALHGMVPVVSCLDIELWRRFKVLPARICVEPLKFVPLRVLSLVLDLVSIIPLVSA